MWVYNYLSFQNAHICTQLQASCVLAAHVIHLFIGVCLPHDHVHVLIHDHGRPAYVRVDVRPRTQIYIWNIDMQLALALIGNQNIKPGLTPGAGLQRWESSRAYY